jgi:hypothetical protein
MLTRRLQGWILLAAVVLAVAVGVAACGLNPQPLPPGEQAPAGSIEDGGATASLPNGSAEGDGAALANSDGGPVVAPPSVTGDGGASGDAGDAAPDGSQDAASDAESDAPADAAEGGG